jgi:hypothetical protein
LLYKGQPLTKGVEGKGFTSYFYLGRQVGTKQPDISVTFMPKGQEKTKKYECDFDAKDSSYKAGFQGKGLPPGEYRISIEQKITGNPKDMVEMNNKFSGEGSPILRELKGDGEMTIDLDLANPEGSPASS